MRSPFVALAVVAGLAHTASAQPPKPDEPPGYYTAAMLSFAATLVPMSVPLFWMGDKDELSTTSKIVMSAGIVFGPTAGHWYAGEWVTPGLVVRLVAAGVVGGLAARDHHKPLSDGATELGAQLVYALVIAGIAFDATTLRDAVKRRNERSLVVAPVVHDRGGGIALVGTL